LIGLTSAAFATVKSTHFTHSGDSSRESTRTCWEACEEALRSLSLIKLLVERVEPNRARMASRAAEDFSTVTDLADLLVRKADASFRDAHHIIGAVVRQALEAGIPAKDITPQMVNAAAVQQLGRQVALREDDIAACLDPVRNVAARQSFGGPAPSLVTGRIGEQQAVLAKQRSAIVATEQRVVDAQDLLRQRVQTLISSESAVTSVLEA
jgi:argininosuccinate lyase